MTLLNTKMKREQEHLARFLHMAKDYARKNGFKGCFFIEPKPMEPTKHQYDFDAATVVGFLPSFGLDKDFKLNIEVNHATLAGHTFQHDLQVAADAGMLGSRNSTDQEDLFIAYISAMDAFSRALIIANDILEKSPYLKMRKDRYASFDSVSPESYFFIES